MELTKFLDTLNLIASHQLYPMERTVTIPVTLPYVTAGGSPCVALKSVNVGFDWDSGKIFLVPEEPLMKVADFTESPNTIREMQKEIGGLVYEAAGYRSEIRRLKRKVKELENAHLQQTN